MQIKCIEMLYRKKVAHNMISIYSNWNSYKTKKCMCGHSRTNEMKWKAKQWRLPWRRISFDLLLLVVLLHSEMVIIYRSSCAAHTLHTCALLTEFNKLLNFLWFVEFSIEKWSNIFCYWIIFSFLIHFVFNFLHNWRNVLIVFIDYYWLILVVLMWSLMTLFKTNVRGIWMLILIWWREKMLICAPKNMTICIYDEANNQSCETREWIVFYFSTF